MDTQYIGACTPPGGGNNSVDPRFMSLFNCINITFPSKTAIETIYTQIFVKHLESRDYPDEIRTELPSKITKATIQLYDEIWVKLPRTPVKFHYIFNLRDLSWVYEGLSLATIDKISKKEDLVWLWRNECLRVFFDKLITEEDWKFINDQIQMLVGNFFPGTEERVLSDPLLFADFMHADPVDEEAEDPRLYEDIPDYKTAEEKLNKMLEDFAYQGN